MDKTYNVDYIRGRDKLSIRMSDLPSDLENNGVTYEGQEVTIGNQKAKVYGNGYTVGYDRSNLSKTKSVVIASESIVANQIKNYITSNNGSLNDIILYQASHHASNVDSYAINTLNLNRGNLYVVAPTSGDVGDDYKLAQHLIFYKLLRNNSSNKHFTTTSYLATKNTIYSEKAVVFTINHEGKIDGSNNNYITTCTNKACDYE